MIVDFRDIIVNMDNVEIIFKEYEDNQFSNAVMIQFKSGYRHVWQDDDADRVRAQLIGISQ